MNISTVLYLAIFAVLYIQSVNADVKQCYLCNGKCKDPLEIQNCTSSTIQNLCMSLTVSSGDLTSVTKQCVPDVEATRLTCKAAEDTDGSSCYTCDKDLCNSGKMYTFSFILISSMFLIISRIL